MKKVNITELAEIVGVTKQAVSKAVRDGLIPILSRNGHTVIIDADDPTVQMYIKDREPKPKKKTVKKTSKKPVKKKVVSKKKSKKAVSKKSVSKKTSKKPAKKNNKKTRVIEKPDENLDDLTPVEINRRSKIAEMKKKEMHIEILKKKFLPTDYVENHLFRYIERLNSTMERSAGVSITEIGEKVLETGYVTPDHIESFVNLILEAIHNTKKAILKDIKKYEPKI